MRERLIEAFARAEALFGEGKCPRLSNDVEDALSRLFDSNTQSHREALVGCTLMALHDSSVDIRKPYKKQASNAYSGRTLDENVVNPFLKEKRVPSSKGPYLASFRRGVDFTSTTRQGIKDTDAFDALLVLLTYLESSNNSDRTEFLVALLCRFIELRETSMIPLLRLNRASAVQYDKLIGELLKIQSGGRIPVMIAAAVLKAIKVCFGLDWTVEVQGINEADAAKGAGGDIAVRSKGEVVLAAEVTERTVDKPRLIATFNDKISPNAISDYIFFATGKPDAIEQANQYFAQGSEVNFVDLHIWANMSLIMVGQKGREAFNTQMIASLDTDVPRNIKVAWNDLVAKITSV